MKTDRTKLAALDHRHLWHPFTQMREWLADEPLVIERGEGNHLIDVDGRRYLDGVSSLWCNVHGHRKPELDRALHEQSEKIAHTTMLGLTNPPAIDLAGRLVEMTPPNLTRVFYSDAGATSVEIALKMAFQYWQLRGETGRTRFATLAEAYHGDTIGSVSLGYSEAFHRFFRPLLFDAVRIDPPHVHRFYRGLDEPRAVAAALDDARRVLREHGKDLAAVFVEPLVQGAAGMWIHPPEYLAGLREITREVGALLVCDEVATGFGKTGTMLAIDQAGIEPDLLCLAKGLTGGYLPLAATLATEEIFEAFLGRYDEKKAFFHGHTYTGNPLACAVAIANLDVFENERTLERLAPKIRRLHALLDSEIAPFRHVADVRKKGILVAIELLEDPETKKPFPPESRVGHRVCLATRPRGVVIRGLADHVFLVPPLSITEEEIDTLVGATAEAIREVAGA